MEKTVQIDCIGDSITSGVKPPSYPRLLRGMFQEQGMESVQVSNRGKEGFTVGEYLEFQLNEPNASMLERRDVDIMIVLLGGNDTRDSKKTPLQDFERNYRALLQLYKKKADRIFMMNIPLYYAPIHIFWRSEYHTFNAAHRIEDELNPLLETLAVEMGIPLIDVMNPLKEAGKSVFLDGIHPNPAGNQIIAELCYQQVYPIVRQLLSGNHL